ncbi:MAG: CdaR family protein [candidate division WOR-3 bacterium]|nr:CdaR family protein [candidate division WOR-3 bacterium]
MLYNIISYITRDPMRKIFATIFAFGLWIYVAIGNNYSYQKQIKVVYTNLSDTLIIVDSVSSIKVTFSGRGGALFSIWAAPPKAQCDLREKESGQFEISTKDLKIPVGYGPLRVDFDKPALAVSIDRKIMKTIAVRVPIKGTLKKGYAISDMIVLDTIDLTGPQEVLDQVSELMTESLNVRNRSISFEKDLRLEIPSPMLDVKKKSVKVKTIIKESMRKTLTDIPLVLIYAPGQSARSERDALDTLIVEGTTERINRLSNTDIEVRVKLTKLGPGEYLLPAEIDPPEYVTPVKSVPQKFKITIY